jgi:hypothetical protein
MHSTEKRTPETHDYTLVLDVQFKYASHFLLPFQAHFQC